jgi:CCR4-NOT complex subunit CAF16
MRVWPFPDALVRQLNLGIFGAPTVDEHRASEDLHQVAAGGFRDRRAHRATIGAGRLAELDLDELVRVERDVERGDEPFGQPVLADLHDGIAMMSERAQKAPLLAVQHRVDIARMDATIDVRALDFAYAGGPAVLRALTLAVPAGARCLLVGANGSGKTTLLSIVAGRHMIADAAVRVLGRPAFSDTALVHDVSFIGGQFPLDVDLTVAELLASRPDADGARRDELVRVLDVDRRWRMCRVSDGQRRRVQLLLGLLWPCRVLLLDEVTTDLDVIARGDLLAFLKAQATTILYATHILEGLEDWATHLAYLDGGRIAVMERLDALDEYRALKAKATTTPLLRLVDGWLRRDRSAR